MDLFTKYSDVLKANPYHDERGRFATGPGVKGSSSKASRAKVAAGLIKQLRALQKPRKTPDPTTDPVGYRQHLDAELEAYRKLRDSVSAAYLSKDQAHAMAKLFGYEGRSLGAAQMKDWVIGALFDEIRWQNYTRHKFVEDRGKFTGAV